MAVDFSVKTNDAKAQAVARRLLERFPEGSVDADSLGNICAYLSEYAKLDYQSTMQILSHIALSGKPSDMLRLAYALVHYQPDTDPYSISRGKVVAHAKIVAVTADKLSSSNPKICIRMLLVSSRHAGRFVDYEIGIRDAVRVQKKVYCGRSKALSGRSLLELVGSVCTAHLSGDSVIYLDSTAEERKLNKQLCADRAKSDSSCPKAPTCVQCKERRSSCRLAVRY